MQTIEGLRVEPVFERVTAALRNNPAATAQELEQAQHGNLCRCTGYTSLRQAVAELART